MKRPSKANDRDPLDSRQAATLWLRLLTCSRFISVCLCLFYLLHPITQGSPSSIPDDPPAAGTVSQEEGRPEEGGLDLSLDYLPMNLGNRWIYNKTQSPLKRTESVKVEIISTPIIKWKTYYVFNQLPFVPGLENANNILVRFDVASHRFLKLTREGEKPLFPVGEQADARFASSVDERNEPVANRLSYLACVRCQNAGMEMVFDRGIGVVAVESTFPWGTETYELKSAEVNRRKFGETLSEGKKAGKQPKFGTGLIRVDPNLTLETQPAEAGLKLIFKVKNPTEGYLSFRFNTSQTYDFIIREKGTGFEIWRWSKSNYFSRVLRNIALLPQDEWEFEETWNYKDNERNDIRRGTYEAVAILTTVEPRESAPAEVAVP